jgi:hypothetical protein
LGYEGFRVGVGVEVLVGIPPTSVGVCRSSSVGDGVKGVPEVGDEATSGVPSARPMMGKFPAARRISSLIERIENCKTCPRGITAPVQ